MISSINVGQGDHMEPTGADSNQTNHELNQNSTPSDDLHRTLGNLHISSNNDTSVSPTTDHDPPAEEERYERYDPEKGYVILRYHFTREDKELFDQRKEEEVNGPDQKYLEILSKAFRSIPTSDFAWGGVISNSQVDVAKLVLRVWKKGSPRQITPKKLPSIKKPKKNRKGKTKRMESDESDDEEEEPPVVATKDNDKE
jgi:hypothetical protein